MNGMLKKCISLLLLISYGVVGIAGHTAALNESTDFNNNLLQFSYDKKTQPVKQRPVWSKLRHFPPTVQTKIVIYLTTTRIALPEDAPLILVIPQTVSIVIPFLSTITAKPRDPPTA